MRTTMSTSSSMNKRNERGSAMVEMAILSSLLVLLFVGITEVGRALYFQHKLTKAVESGARYLGRSWEAVDTADCTEGASWAPAVVSTANLAVYGSAGGGTVPAISGFLPAHVSASVSAVTVDGITDPVCVVRVSAAVPYIGIFFFHGDDGFLPPIILGGGGGWTLTAASEERYVGD